jgi:hypothetical protein
MTTASSPESSLPVSPVKAKYPRRNRKSPPKEIHLSPAAATKRSSSDTATSNNHKNTATKKTTATADPINADTPLRKSGVMEDLRRVLLISGSSWLNTNGTNNNGAAAAGAAAEAVSTAAPPAPPGNPPPRPTELLSLLMVGPDDAGKKALLEQFVHDSNANPSKKTSSMSKKHDSSSSSPQKKSPEGWSVEYRKKDWAYHRSGSSTTSKSAASASASAAESSSSVQCVRLQLWNATVNNSNSNTGNATLPPDASLVWPAALKTHCQHMILVVSMADSKSLAELQKTVRTWKRYLDHATGRKSTSGTTNTMQLILTLPTASSMQKHAAYYLRVGAAMQRLATELSMLAPSWAVLDTQPNEASTSVHEIHATWMNITEQVLSSKQQQQRQGSLADQRYAVATAAAVSTPASRGNKKVGGSLDNSSSSPGTIVLDAQDVITISPDKDEHLTR